MGKAVRKVGNALGDVVTAPIRLFTDGPPKPPPLPAAPAPPPTLGDADVEGAMDAEAIRQRAKSGRASTFTSGERSIIPRVVR